MFFSLTPSFINNGRGEHFKPRETVDYLWFLTPYPRRRENTYDSHKSLKWQKERRLTGIRHAPYRNENIVRHLGSRHDPQGRKKGDCYFSHCHAVAMAIHKLSLFIKVISWFSLTPGWYSAFYQIHLKTQSYRSWADLTDLWFIKIRLEGGLENWRITVLATPGGETESYRKSGNVK